MTPNYGAAIVCVAMIVIVVVAPMVTYRRPVKFSPEASRLARMRVIWNARQSEARRQEDAMIADFNEWYERIRATDDGGSSAA